MTLALALFAAFALPTHAAEPTEPAGDSPAAVTPADAPATQPASGVATAPNRFPALQFTLPLVGGGELDLSRFRGRVLVIVPVAWDANRRQFEDLQLYANRLSDRGLAVVGVLTRDFNSDARSDADIAAAIRERYRITFPLVASTPVTGDNIHPLFKYLTATDAGHGHGGPVAAPFTKFLIDRNGELVHRWDVATRLTSDEAIRRTLQVIDTPMR
ncbi:MAG: hypothetical protein ACK4PI_04985 [Tepidisphaerales bacterium]